MPTRSAARVLLPLLVAGVVTACSSTGAAPIRTRGAPTATAAVSAPAGGTPSAAVSPATGLLTPVAGQPPVTGRPWVLAIRDSVTSGLTYHLPQLDQLNAVGARVAAAQGARLAELRGALNTVKAGNDPHPCASVHCAHGDLHPTVAGHARLARAALAALDAR